MTDITIDAGTLLFAADDPLAATGLLVPYGVEARSNLGRFTVDPGTFEIPADVTGMGVHDQHERERVVGGFQKIWEQPEAGILFAMRFADTPEGRAAAEDARTGKRKSLSVEASDVRIKSGKAISGRIFGAAIVDRPAFAGATLLAAEDTVEIDGVEVPAESESTSSWSTTGSDGSAYSDTSTTTEKVEDLGEGKKRITRTTVTVTEVTEPDEESDENEGEEPDMGNATVNGSTLNASAPDTKKNNPTANEVFDMMASVLKGEDTAGTLLAALTDIKISGSGQLPTGGNAVQPAWLGEVYAAKSYTRRYAPLILHGNITALDEKGFAVATGTEPVQAWNGNKAEMPTVAGTTTAISSVFQRWGVANDIAREFYDIPAGRSVIEAYIRLLVNSYDRVVDKWTLQQLVTAAGTQVDYDDTDVPTGYNDALAKVIQVIDLVDETDADPTFVVVGSAVWRALRYTQKDLIPEYVSFSLGRTEGSADGGVVVLKDKTGSLAADQVLGGGRDVAHLNELPGATPMQLDALDIAHGGIDKAILGYSQFMAEYADGLVLLGDPEA